jgi:hypothetical protein
MISRFAGGLFGLGLLGLALATPSPVQAASVGVPTLSGMASPTTDAQYRRDRSLRPHDRRRRYVPGGRYDSPPPRWRRYGSRPGNWRRRGCVVVGPVWFCP